MALTSGIDWKTAVVAVLLVLFAVPMVQRLVSKVA